MRLFSRRNTPTDSSTGSGDPTDGDYVLPEKPIYNIPISSASKLKLPFRRRQQPVYTNDAQPRISSVMSDPGHDLPSPPRKSSIFGVYNQSAHSLPNDPSSVATPSSSDVPTPAQPQKKPPGFFSWARERTKSKPPQPSFVVPPVDPSSFNLRSFRHVLPDSPASLAEQSPKRSPQPLSDPLPPPPRPRPRGDSIASDSSQRISVAAFREAHARSRANSPAPSFRPPSTADTLRVDAIGRKRASTVSVVSSVERQQPSKNTPAPMPSARPGPSASDSSSNDSDSEDDEDVDSDGEPIPKPAQKRTPPRRRDASPARTDAGHGSASTHIDPHTSPTPAQLDPAPLARKRPSVSTSALTPNPAGRRPSVLAGTTTSSTSQAQSRHSSRKPKDDSDQSTDSSDSEDIPLSGLVAPRRPGSSASNNSNSRPRMPPKPLIDINTLAGGPPLLAPILRHENSVKNFHKQAKESDLEKDQPFSVPAVLTLSASPSPPISPSVTKQNPPSADKPVSTAYHRRSSNDVPVLPTYKEPDNDDDLINAIRLVGALDKEKWPDHSPAKSPTDRIIPTHIREREPPTSFTVLSRPHRQSFADTSTSPSSASPTQSSISARSPPPEIGARQRASTMVHSSSQKDKSDTMSIASVARSTRTSRIPPVPLIQSIPDSPSLKEEYKHGRPRAVSGTSILKSSQGRSQPPPPMPVSAMKQTKTPPRGFQSRPFASNSSVGGDSPAGSSTGDSSSGRAPFTPRDGSDIGMRSKDDGSDPGATLRPRHAKKHSVTFEDELHSKERPKSASDEQRTRVRRRSEAKAALELGKIVNGRGPLKDDWDEDVRERNPTISVTMEDGASVQPGWGWQQPMGTGMGGFAPQMNVNSDPAYMAAHQRALLIAKQAYQMAVAQHAMQVAGEEWERSSNAGFGSGGSVYGGGSGGSVYGGSGGSVYGGSGGSVYGGGMPMGMMGMPNMGMLMPPNPWAARSSIAFPSTASVYGISSSQSEYGGGWGTQSVYGDSFGSASRAGLTGNGSASAHGHGGGSRPRAWTGTAPPSSSSQPSKVPGKGAVRSSRAAPPSSWKSGR